MFDALEEINTRPKPFEFYIANDLWTDPHISEQMLSYHLDGDNDTTSRNFGFIDRSVEWITSHFQIGLGKCVADFGCGPGLYTTRLARQQADVTGIDFSKRSIKYAQGVAAKEALEVDYVNQNYLAYETEKRFDLCLMITCDFCVLSPDQRKSLLNKFYTLLKPGGYVLLDVHSLAHFKAQRERTVYENHPVGGFWSPAAHYSFLNRFKYKAEKVVLDKYTLVEQKRTRTIYNWFQCFSADSLATEFLASGFQVEKLYSDVAGASFDSDCKEFAIVVKKQS